MLTSKDFANKLRKVIDKEKQTKDFERERDKAGERKYAQKDDRWWDESTGTQKEHVVCWFARKYYSEGSTKECIKENLIEQKNCKECYFEKNEIMLNCNQIIGAKDVFAHMKRPEMYLYIVEALDVIDENKLQECIRELKKRMDENPKEWKEVINKYITWDMVERKVL